MVYLGRSACLMVELKSQGDSVRFYTHAIPLYSTNIIQHNDAKHIQNAIHPTRIYLYKIPSTISAIASELVNPGLSIPNKFTNPGNPASS